MIKTVDDVKTEFKNSCKEFVKEIGKEDLSDSTWDKISTRLEKSTKDLLEYCLMDNDVWKTIFFHFALSDCPMGIELWGELEHAVKTR